MESTFTKLYAVDVSTMLDTTKKEWKDKHGAEKSMTYTTLHWTQALRELRTMFPKATWNIREFEGSLPYLLLPNRTALVYVSVTVEGDERGTWLPVMDSKHDAIVEPDSFDINTAHFRCFVKACAMHGLGLKVYEADDKPADKASSKYPPMKAAGADAPFNLAVTFLAVRELDKNWKVEGVTENRESVKLTIWKRQFPAIPAIGETVLIDGRWEVSEKWGDSVTVEKIAAITEGEGGAGAGQGDAEPKKIADSPAARAQVLKKYKALTEQADALGVKYETPEELSKRHANVDDLMDAGVKLSAAIEKAKRDAADTGSQAQPKQRPAAAGWPA